MTFEVAAESYDRFMGRYSAQLAPQLAEFGGVCAGQRVLDVGCGPGALTSELVRRVGGEAVTAAGLKSVQEASFEASVEFTSFEEWWDPFTLGVGPAGAYAKTLDDPARTRLRDHCRQLLPLAPFTVNSTAWTARGFA